jgi:predicted CXXCH cytochrome family protein
MSGTLKERSHWQFSANAHLGNINPQSSNNDEDFASGLLDTESQTCLSCHEGVTATVSENFGGTPDPKGMDVTSNHPIGMSYSNTASRNSLKYNMLSKNNEHIRLFDGRMGCGSCHSLYSGIKKNLVQDNRGSRLCFECHNM